VVARATGRSAFGPSRHFVAVQQFGCFRREADIDLAGTSQKSEIGTPGLIRFSSILMVTRLPSRIGATGLRAQVLLSDNAYGGSAIGE